MIDIVRTDSSNTDFQGLVAMLDADLKIRDGAQHEFYNQFNKITHIRNAIVAYREGIPVGCGAFRDFSPDTVEIKRMYVKPGYRGQGVAKTVLGELEQWAEESGIKSCVLETGMNQPEAIQLYQKTGYKRIPNYGQYAKIENSVCMKKDLEKSSLIPGEIADYRYEDGILYSYSKSIRRTVDNISGNVELVKKITGGKKVPLLIYLADSPVPDKETRKFSTEKLPEIYTAMAMVAKPGLTQLIMGILFRFNAPPIPMKSFTDPVKAKEWLQQYVR
jgi:putative acetyltransferase